MRFFVTMLLVLLPLCAQDPPPQKKGGGGGAARNLKVLTPDELRSGVMQQFVAALGVQQSGGCNYCHVQDKAADDKKEKVTARAMISMVKDINATIAKSMPGETGKVYVTCYTCHRGKTEPETKAAALP